MMPQSFSVTSSEEKHTEQENMEHVVDLQQNTEHRRDRILSEWKT